MEKWDEEVLTALAMRFEVVEKCVSIIHIIYVNRIMLGTRRQYVATGGTLLSTWCSETVRLIVRWIYFECTDRPSFAA